MAFGQCSEAIQILSRGNPNPRRSRVEFFLKKRCSGKRLRGTLRFEKENRFVLFLARFVLRASHVSFCGLYGGFCCYFTSIFLTLIVSEVEYLIMMKGEIILLSGITID